MKSNMKIAQDIEINQIVRQEMEVEEQKQLLFFSHLNSYWYDGNKYYERDEFYNKGSIKEVKKEKVQRIANLNGTEQFLPIEGA